MGAAQIKAVNRELHHLEKLLMIGQCQIQIIVNVLKPLQNIFTV